MTLTAATLKIVKLYQTLSRNRQPARDINFPKAKSNYYLKNISSERFREDSRDFDEGTIIIFTLGIMDVDSVLLTMLPSFVRIEGKWQLVPVGVWKLKEFVEIDGRMWICIAYYFSCLCSFFWFNISDDILFFLMINHVDEKHSQNSNNFWRFAFLI